MNSIIFDSHGEIIQDFSNTHVLKIIWAKAFNEVYCHHASLNFPFFPVGLFPDTYFKVSVKIRQQVIEKGNVKSFSDKIVSAHLEGNYNNDNTVLIPLNSVRILDGLCENEWTSLKNGERGKTKSFPLSISVENDNKKHLEFSFHHLEGKFPFTICESEFNKLSDDEKLETIIVLQ